MPTTWINLLQNLNVHIQLRTLSTLFIQGSPQWSVYEWGYFNTKMVPYQNINKNSHKVLWRLSYLHNGNLHPFKSILILKQAFEGDFKVSLLNFTILNNFLEDFGVLRRSYLCLVWATMYGRLCFTQMRNFPMSILVQAGHVQIG